MKKIIPLLLLIPSLLWAQTKEQDLELGRLFARYAWDAYSVSDWPEMENLTDKGLEYDDRNPDLLCFKGILAQKDSDYAQAEQWLSKAFYNAYNAEQLDMNDIIGRLFEIYFRLGRYDEIESLYVKTSEIGRDDPDVLFYTVLSTDMLGKRTQAAEMATEGVYRYQDQRFLILLAGWDQESDFGGILSEYIKRQGILYPDLMARTIIAESDNALLSSLYLEQFNDMNSWYIRSKVLGLAPAVSVEKPAAERIWPLRVIVEYLETKENPLAELTEMAPLSLDRDDDGIADLYVSAEDGLHLWKSDRGQDGSIDFQIAWDSEQLVSVTILRNDMLRSYGYYDYPYVDTVSISGGDRNSREYSFLPGGYAHALAEAEANLPMHLLESGEKLLDIFVPETDLLNYSFSLRDTVTEPDHRIFREYTVVSGRIVRFREDSNFDGLFDRVVLLKDWLPYEGFRDVDNDGQYDLKEKYIGGRFAAFEFEGEHSRVEEYQDLWNRRRFQLWDFSKDNFYDARLEKRSDGSWDEIILEGDLNP